MADLSTLTTREYSQPVIRSRKSLRISEAIYWKKYYHHPDIIYEWKNGKLEEKCMADHLDYLMYKWFLKLLDEYLDVKLILPNSSIRAKHGFLENRRIVFS